MHKSLLILTTLCLFSYSDVDLSLHFPKETPVQVGGSCHVYALVGLFEAACYRHFGHRIKLSEAYLFYRSVRGSILTGEKYEKTPRFLSQYDTSMSYRMTLDRIQRSYICESEDFIFDPDFIEAIKSENLSKIENCVAEKLKDKGKVNNEGVFIKAISEKVTQCIEGIPKYKIEKYSKDRALELLDKGIPFTCTGNATYQHGGGPHIFLITGYSVEKGEIKWKLRDSLGKPMLSFTCDEITYYP